MPVRLNGSTSGYVELAAPAVAGTTSLELPTDSIKPGLVLVASQSFSAVSSVSVNNCFSATYDNYRIVMRTVLASSAGTLNARLRSSGTDNTNSSYQTITFYAAANNTYGNQNADYNINTWYAGNVDTFMSQYVYDITSPQKSEITMMTSHAAGSRSGASGLAMYSGAFRFDATTSFDGITFYPATSTMTGSIRVYGYRNSL